jgi:hypothetical protein
MAHAASTSFSVENESEPTNCVNAALEILAQVVADNPAFVGQPSLSPTAASVESPTPLLCTGAPKMDARGWSMVGKEGEPGPLGGR